MPLARLRRGVTILVVAHDSEAVLPRFLDHLSRVAGPQDEIVLVDNGSRDASPRLLADFAAEDPDKRRVAVSPYNLGYAAGVNLGLHYVDRAFVALLHPDVLPHDAWLQTMLDHMSAHPGAVAIAAGEGESGACPATVVTGGCVLIDSEALDQARGLDERYFFGGELRALSLRLREAGGTLLSTGDVPLDVLPEPARGDVERLRRRYMRLQGEELFAEDAAQSRSAEAAAMIANDEHAPDLSLASIVIPIKDNLDLTRKCIESIYQHTRREIELILVDNGSSEDVAGYAGQLGSLKKHVRYLRNEHNEGFGYAVNQGLAVAQGDYLVVLNNDVRVTSGWLSRSIALLRTNPGIALVGPMTNRASGPQVVAGATYDDASEADAFAAEWGRAHSGQFSFSTRVVGLCWVMRRRVIEKVGGFDPCFWLGNFEDDDLCLRLARSGDVAAIAHDVFVHHEGSATWRDSDIDYAALMRANWRWFCHKWEYDGRLGERYPAREMALRRPFDPERDRVPVDPAAVFHRDAEPLFLQEARRHRVLLFADPGGAGWEAALREYLTTVAEDDPCTLVVRIEPPVPDVVDEISRRIEAVVRDSGVVETELPDVLLETSRIAPSKRGGLYTASTALLSVEGPRQQMYEREARACGLKVESTVADLALGRARSRSGI